MAHRVEQKLNELGLDLPPTPTPPANFVGAVQTGNLVFVSGHVPRHSSGRLLFQGKLGRDLTIDEGYQAARLAVLNCLSSLKAVIGDLDRVTRVVKVFGMVNSAPEFEDPPKVVNGASDLLVEVFGERGRHARSAVGMATLPAGVPVEIEMIVEVS